MFTERKLPRSLAIVATLALYAFMTQSAAARGGGGHGGGGHHGGGHHASHHGGEHNHHAYHPSHHHAEHHASHHGDHHHDAHHDDHHHVAHHNHHHHDWHHGDWGPGYWGGAGLGYAYGGWNGWGDGGDTYVDNSTNVTPASDESDSDSDADASDNTADASNDENPSNDASGRGFPTDNWPELGIVTYAGQYGGSQGQVIVRVIPGSAAEKAGLVPGDVILTFNGQPVPSADDLDSAMDTANGKFEVEVWDARTGRKSTLSGALDAAAAPPATTNETTAFAPVQ